MSQLISSDIASAGIWRALIVKPIDQGRFSIYIPALHKAQMPFKDPENPKNGLIETNDKGEFTSGGLTMTLNDYPIANSCVWQARTVMDTGECVWVMFENGDVNYPVIMGQVGSNIALTWDVASLMSGASGSSSSNIAFTGNNIDYIFARLLEQKYPNAAICGILANIEAESGIRTDNLQNSYEASLNYTDEAYTEAVSNGTYSKESFINDSAGYGLIQWTSSGRKRLLYMYTVDKGRAVNDIEAQVSLLIDELVSWGLADRLKSVSNDLEGAHQAAYIFCTEFEIPANKEEKAKERQNTATTYWNTYKEYTPEASTIEFVGPVADKISQFLAVYGTGSYPAVKVVNNTSQCVDLAVKYLQEVFGLGNPGGNGVDIAANVVSKYGNAFKKVDITQPFSIQPGDIVSWKGSTPGFTEPYGHVGIGLSGNANLQTVLDQWAATSYVQRDNYTGRPLAGIARPIL